MKHIIFNTYTYIRTLLCLFIASGTLVAQQQANVSLPATIHPYNALQEILKYSWAKEIALKEKNEINNNKQETILSLENYLKGIPPFKSLDHWEQELEFCTLFDKHTTQSNKKTIADIAFFRDSEIFCDYDGEEKGGVLAKMEKPKTIAGNLFFKKQLLDMTDNVEELKKRQNIVKYLVEHESVLNELESLLKIIGTFELIATSIWTEKKRFLKTIAETGQMLITPKILFGAKNPIIIEIARYIVNAIKVVCLITFPLSIIILIIAIIGAFVPMFLGCNALIVLFIAFVCIVIIVITSVVALFTGIFSLISLLSIKRDHDILSKILTLMHALARVFESSNKLQNIFKNHPQLANLITTTMPLCEETGQNDFEQLQKSLQTKTFDEPQADTVYLNQGQLLTSAYIAATKENNMMQFLQSIGEIDAYVTAARIFKNFQATSQGKNNVSFVEFSDGPDSCLDIKGVWHPVINPSTAVRNDLSLGKKADTCGYQIQGPNMGGKSTYLKSVAISLIFATAYGYGFCENMKYKPVSYLKSYMNTQDKTGSASLFQAQMYNVKEWFTTLNKLPQGQSALIITDEMFTGTAPKEGFAGAFASLFTIYKKYPNCMFLAATHYKDLAKLEECSQGKIKNYKVIAYKNPDGSFNFPYKIYPGATTQTIGFDLLKQNFDPVIIQYAEEARQKFFPDSIS